MATSALHEKLSDIVNERNRPASYPLRSMSIGGLTYPGRMIISTPPALLYPTGNGNPDKVDSLGQYGGDADAKYSQRRIATDLSQPPHKGEVGSFKGWHYVAELY